MNNNKVVAAATAAVVTAAADDVCEDGDSGSHNDDRLWCGMCTNQKLWPVTEKKQVSGQNFQKVHLLYIVVTMMVDYDVKSVPIKNYDQQQIKTGVWTKFSKGTPPLNRFFNIIADL